MSDTRVMPVEELRQVAFPQFPEYSRNCERSAVDPDCRFGTRWFCTRHPGHEGPHMATYLGELEEAEFVDVDIIGFAWTEKTLSGGEGR